LHESGIKIETLSNEGPAADVILNAVAVSHADLIVMTPHGHGGIKRWLLGGTTDKLIHRSTVPILLVRDTQAAQASPSETYSKQHAFFVHSL
jgi:nucleotide-binding universal stress UspA family protein